MVKPLKIEAMAKERKAICKSNKCGHYDAKGDNPGTFIKGKPACGVCGCNINFLAHSPESECSLTEIGKKPLWRKANL